ncbi:MAG: ARPP-1 family domain-containing protein [bacterium]
MIRKTTTVLVIAIIGLCVTGWSGFRGDGNVNDVMTLLKAGVGEEVIKAHIAEKGMTFRLSTRDITKLKRAGASDGLLTYMITCGTDDFPFELETDLIVKRPAVHKHLAIFPVFRKTSVEIGDYITLDDAQRARVVVISEHPSATVPTVVIRNIGRKPIYIMAGEMIIGGKQDRMVSHDVLVPAGKEIEVAVKCVEHGRWHGRSAKFKSGGAVASRAVRSALQFKGQQDVWNEVSRACEEHNAESESGTYRAILASEDVGQRSKPFLDAMKQGLRDDDMVGMIMALNGRVVCVDILANPRFFAKVKDKLLKAYVLDAIGAKETSTEIPGKKEIVAFFEELKVAKTDELKRYNANTNFELESEQIIGNESRDEDGKLQHLNLYRR